MKSWLLGEGVIFFWYLGIIFRRFSFQLFIVNDIELCFIFIPIKNYWKDQTFCKTFCYNFKIDFLFLNSINSLYNFWLFFAFFIRLIHWLIELIDRNIHLVSLIRLVWWNIKNLNLLIYFFKINLLFNYYLRVAFFISFFCQNHF